MSIATTATSSKITHLPPTPHPPHTAHPIPLREQAFTLHCQGLRSPAIAAELGVPERTVRAWIAAALAELKDDLQLNRKEQLLLAVERQHQLTATAWQQFHHEAAARDALLDAALDTLRNANDPGERASISTRPLHLHLPASTPAPRYLSLILQANKETNRLLGLHTLAKLHLLTPDVPDIPEAEPTPFTDSDSAAESATASASPRPVGAAHGGASDVVGAERAESEAVGFPTESATANTDLQNPAKTATAPAFRPTIPAPAVYGRDSLLPAESATGSGSPLLAGAGSVRSRYPGAGFPRERVASGDRA